MKKEINNRQLESKTLKEDVENTKRENVLEAKELEKSQDEMEKLKVKISYTMEGIYLGFNWCSFLNQSVCEFSSPIVLVFVHVLIMVLI